MKNPLDPRHQRRQKLIQDLFRIEFTKQEISEEANNILEKVSFIDEKIEKAAPEFPIDKINKVDLAILRLAIYELLLIKKEPPKVIVDEAVELAKEFGGETSPGFVNGALGNILNETESS